MDGGRRVLRSVSEALAGLGPNTSDRPLLAVQSAGASSATFTFSQAPRASLHRPRRLRASRGTRFTEAAKRHGTALLVFGLIGTSIGYGIVRGGAYATFVEQYGQPLDVIARNLGLPIAAVTISGQIGLSEAEIMQASGISEKNSLAFLDVGEVRARLRSIPLVQEASVRKLYPDSVVIEITERQPYALWQQDGHISVVAADGTAIDTLRDGRFADLPFVVGEGANTHLPEYLALLAKAGDLKSKIRAGVYVGNRRWTLSTTTGVEVMLPELDPEAAIVALALLERESRVLEKDVISLDLRFPDRLVARLSEEAAAQRAETLGRKGAKQKPGQT